MTLLRVRDSRSAPRAGMGTIPRCFCRDLIGLVSFRTDYLSKWLEYVKTAAFIIAKSFHRKKEQRLQYVGEFRIPNTGQSNKATAPLGSPLCVNLSLSTPDFS
jgi:hypothetical protein